MSDKLSSIDFPPIRRIGPKTAVTSNKVTFSALIQQLCAIPPLVIGGRPQSRDRVSYLRESACNMVKRLLGDAFVVSGPQQTESFKFDPAAEILEIRLHMQLVGRESIRVHVVYKEPFDTRAREVWLELDPAEYFKPTPEVP